MSVDTTQKQKRRTSALPQMQVARVTLPEEIYRRLKTMILDGGLMPGELVTIQAWPAPSGSAPMPVREALQRLTAEGALRVISGRRSASRNWNPTGWSISPRCGSRSRASPPSWATPLIGKEDIAKLEVQVETMTKAVEDGDTRAYVRANHDFHFTIYAASDPRPCSR